MKCDRKWWNDGRLDQEVFVWLDQEAILTLWVITDHPSDFPDYFMVRKQTTLRCGLIVHGEGAGFFKLENARAWCAQFGLVPIPREEDDDPVIVESWI